MATTESALAQAALAAQHLARGEHMPALERLAAALALDPQVDALWAQFSDLIRWFNLRHPVPPPVRQLLASALEHRAVDPGDLVRPLTSLALSQADPLAEPLLIRLLEDMVIRDAGMERLLTERRRAMLERIHDPAPPLDIAVAIAHQCFNTEYVFDQSADEARRVERLADAIAASSAPPAHWFAVYAAYRPLRTLGRAQGAPASLLRRQVADLEEEERLRAAIPALTGSAAGVTAAVRELYEANPYPRWIRMATAGFAPATVPQATRILVAGCGTGQHPIGVALRHPDAQLLAVDLSRASLAYAMRKTRELGVENIEYRQADLLRLGDMSERFDLIESSGVLHHLEDPLAGWRVLKGLLKPGGRMRIGLYSATGRRHVLHARALVAAEGWQADAQGIRACRAAIRGRSGDALLARVARNEDFFSLSGCRDLLFHVQETSYSLGEIARMIDTLGLRFAGFEFQDSGATLARFKGDPLSLSDWQRFEQEFPDTFARMYQFWVA